MIAIFSRSVFLGLLLSLSGCGEREPTVIDPPREAAAVIEPFLKELAAGNREKAAAYVSTAATDELATQFVPDHKKLAAAPKLTPRFVNQDATPSFGSGDEVNLVYAAKSKGKWTSATVRVYRYRDEPYKVEYWRVTDKAPVPPLNSNLDPEKLKQSQDMMRWIFGALAIFGLLGLALLIWLIKRRPQLVSPDAPAETRRSAATVRDE
jgi:hypothetical protein